MKPWEILFQLKSTAHPEEILENLEYNDPFWLISYAIDPFILPLVKLPLGNPNKYGLGVDPVLFLKLAKFILNGSLFGNQLVLALERFSHSCTKTEWEEWYRPILEGNIDIKLPLELFNRFCPDEFGLHVLSTNKPRILKKMTDLPDTFIIQPIYEGIETVWFVNGKGKKTEIRGYTCDGVKYHNAAITEHIYRFYKNSLSVVLFGTVEHDTLIIEDIVTRDQFEQEAGALVFRDRLKSLSSLNYSNCEIAQFSTEININVLYKEFNLILEQGYKGILVRNPNAHYPFRIQADISITPSIPSIVTITDGIIDNESPSLIGEFKKGKNVYTTIIKLGLTDTVCRGILVSSIVGKRCNILSCGFDSNTLLFPRFLSWKE
jgi:hypothetical protein